MKRFVYSLIMICFLVSNITIPAFAEVTKSNADVKVKVGEKYTLEAVLKYMSQYNLPIGTKIKWQSSDTKIATVSANGIVTGVKQGGAIIKASAIYNNATYRAEAKVYVISTVTGVKLNQQAVNLFVGQTEKLIETILPADAYLKSVTWKSSNAKVASVSNGTVKGIGAGTADISVITKDGAHTAICKVTVVSTVTGVKLSDHALSKYVGEEFYITATVLPESCYLKTVKWISSNSKIVSVSSGKLKAVAEGVAVVTAETVDGKYTDQCTITVESTVTGVTLSKYSLTILKGTTDVVTAIVIPANALEKRVTWKSSNAKVATVNNDGVVTGVDEGTATVTATTKDGKYTATCSVRVLLDGISISKIELAEEEMTVNFGEEIGYSYKTYPENAVTQKITGILMLNGKKVKTIEVKTNPLYLKLMEVGTYTLTIQLESNPAVFDSCKITVKSMTTGIEMDKTSLDLLIGETIKLTARAMPETAIVRDVKWTSSDTKLVRINAKTGEISGLAEGRCTVTAITVDGGWRATRDVIIRKPTDIEKLRLKDQAGNIIGEKPGAATTTQPEPIKITIDGELLVCDQQPVIVNNRVLAPVRAIFEGLGATMDWDPELRVACGILGETAVIIAIDEDQAMVNDEFVSLDSPAKIINGRTMVPVRFIAESLGIDVAWDPAGRTVIITTGY